MRASDNTHLCPNTTNQLVDLWRQDATYDGPALGLNNSYELCNAGGGRPLTGSDADADAAVDPPYPSDPVSGLPMDEATCQFEDATFHREVMNRIGAHDVR